MGFWSEFFGLSEPQQRAAYTRTDGDLLIQDMGSIWTGIDSGGGSRPIGPNGPYPAGVSPLPIITRATALITGPLTSGPMYIQTGVNRHHPRWLADPMLVRPDERMFGSPNPSAQHLTRANFWADWIRSAIWWGHGAFIFAEGAKGAPTAGTLQLINPLAMSTRRMDDGLHWVINDPEDTTNELVFSRDGSITMGSLRYRLAVLRNPHAPVGPEGHSAGVFEVHPEVFKIAEQIQTYTSGTFRSGIPAGYLKVNRPDFDQRSADELKRRWMESHGGDRRSIAVLNASTEFTPLNLSPIDAALDKVKRLSVADAAMAFGIDPMTLGASLNTSMTYSNVRDAWSNHRDFGLAPWRAAIEDTLSALVPSGSEVLVDLDGFANPTIKERYEAGSIAVTAGLLTTNEWRAGEGLTPITGGDDLRQSGTPTRAALESLPQPEEEGA